MIWLIGVLTSAIAYGLGLPSPWLLGAMVGAWLYGFAAKPQSPPLLVSLLTSGVLGLSIASFIDADFGQHLWDWRASIGAMLVMLVLTLSLSFAFFRYACRWSPRDSFLSATPGNLTFIVAYAQELGVAIEKVIVVHTLRLMLLILCLPALFPIYDLPDHVTGDDVARKLGVDHFGCTCSRVDGRCVATG